MKLCRNKKTGAIYWWNEYLKDDPDIEILPEEAIEEKKEEEKPKPKKKKEDILTNLLE